MFLNQGQSWDLKQVPPKCEVRLQPTSAHHKISPNHPHWSFISNINCCLLPLHWPTSLGQSHSLFGSQNCPWRAPQPKLWDEEMQRVLYLVFFIHKTILSIAQIIGKVFTCGEQILMWQSRRSCLISNSSLPLWNIFWRRSSNLVTIRTHTHI